MTERQIPLDEEQNEAFERAHEQIQRDVDDGLVEAECWGGSVQYGEAVRVLAEAYEGRLDIGDEDEEEGDEAELVTDGGTNTRKPMVFSTDSAFRRLEKTGSVVTARAEEKEPGPVWIRRGRNEEKEFDAERELVDEFTPGFFVEYAKQHCRAAGFISAQKWIDALYEHHDGIPNPVYVYYVEREEEEDA